MKKPWFPKGRDLQVVGRPYANLRVIRWINSHVQCLSEHLWLLFHVQVQLEPGSTRRRPPSEAPAKPLRCFAPATASLSEFSGWHPGIRDQFKLGRWTTFSYWPVSSWDCLLSSKTWDSMIMVMHSLVRHPWKWGDFIPTSTRSHQFHGWNITRSPATSFGSAIFDLLKSPDQLLFTLLALY